MTRETQYHSVDAELGSIRLRNMLEYQFAMFSRAYQIDYLAARDWLMDRKVTVGEVSQ